MFEWLIGYPLATYQQAEWAFASTWPLGLLYTAVIVASCCIVLFLVRVRGSIPPLRLLGVGLLQSAIIILILVLLWQPVLLVERLKPNQNSIALMLDVSQSMTYGREGEPRIQKARELLDSDPLVEVQETYPTDRFAFAGETILVDSFDSLPNPGAETRIADSLVEVLERAKSKSLAALVVISDGSESGQPLTSEQLTQIAAYGVPVHSIGVGRETIAEDLELESVIVADKVLPNTLVTAEVSILHDAAGAARLKVYSDGEFLASKEVQLNESAANTNAQIEFDLGEAGFKELSFQLDPLADERNLENNQRNHLVEVAGEQYSVLYVEGEPRWEYKYIRRALAGDPTTDLMTLLWVSDNKFYRQGIDDPSQLETGFPSDKETLFAFDALVIGSMNAPRLTAAQQELVREFVSERGGSLLMLGGRHGLAEGSWGNTPVADVLPVRLKSLEQSFVREPARAVLTLEGAEAAFLTFDELPEANSERWEQLPPLDNYQKLGTLRPAASTLLSLQTDSERNETYPLLVSQPYGKGQSFVLATGGTWRWQMNLPSDDDSHQTFWRQLMRSMVVNSPEKMSFSVESRGGEFKLVAEVRDELYQPVDDVRVVALVSSDNGEQVDLSASGVELNAAPDVAGRYEARIQPGQTGTYYIEAIASRGDQPLDSARVAIHQADTDSESFGIRQDRAQLERIAEATGGSYWSAETLDGLPGAIENSSAGIVEQIRYPLWGIPLVFICLLLIKTSEWLLRRRWGFI